MCARIRNVRIFHIVAPGVWAEASRRGVYLPAGFTADGFVHFSFADQVARTANARYRDEPGLVVVEVESDDVPSELRVEDSYGAGEEFPHVYGPVPTAAAVAVHELTRGPDGDWRFSPPDGAAGSASPGR
jgi:uncharacterized protein (DUF952 family)